MSNFSLSQIDLGHKYETYVNQSYHRNKNNGHHVLGKVVWDLEKSRLTHRKSKTYGKLNVWFGDQMIPQNGDEMNMWQN